MTWNYRIIKHEDPDPERTWFGLHEVHYNCLDEPHSYSSEPISFAGDESKDIIWSLDRALKDSLTKPVLDIKTDLRSYEVPFDRWWQRLLEVAQEQNLPVNRNDPEAYRPSFEDGLTPLNALMEYTQYA